MKTDDAKNILSELESRRSATIARRDETEAKIKDVSFDALTGNAAAAKELAKLESDVLRYGAEIRSLEHAIATAKRKVTAAEAAVIDAQECENAREAIDLLEQFAKRGQELDARLQDFVAEYVALTSDFRKLVQLGFAPTSLALIQANMRAATATKLQFTDLRQTFLAPHERRDFVGVIEGWAANVRARATARLNRNTPRKAA